LWRILRICPEGLREDTKSLRIGENIWTREFLNKKLESFDYDILPCICLNLIMGILGINSNVVNNKLLIYAECFKVTL
jgi:hypothetical protein